jgi:excinuclease ABC subunit C
MAFDKPSTKDIPDSPGTYLFRDAHKRVIYVGKAKSLRNRIPNYFGTLLNNRIEAMVGQSADVEWIVTSNEVEALQLEVSLIKEHRPRYNIKYTDDKSYPYLALTTSEEFPRATVTRGRKKKGDRFYGPFAHAYAIRETLDLLLRVFPIRSCSKGVFDRARSQSRPCLLFHIGRCSAPCTGEIDTEGHRELVKKFGDFMAGKHDPVIDELTELMNEASKSQDYENAARFRDRLLAVRKVIEKQQMVTAKEDNLDAIAFEGDPLEAAFQVFFVRSGRMVGRKGFIVDRVEDLSEAELMGRFLETLYGEDTGEVPREINMNVAPAGKAVLEEWLSGMRGGPVRIHVPRRGSKKALIDTVRQNAKEAFIQSRLKRAGDFAARSKALNDLQVHLDLPDPPLRIECFDISNLGPAEVVGSMVVFEDALPKKSDYRKFKIHGVEGQDDVASMGEVIKRRFARFLEEEKQPPDASKRFSYRPSLVVVDGGKGQLNRTVEAMSELGVVGIPVVSLAKKYEEVFVPGESAARVLPRGSEALYLLQRLRDEAHRFAITYQRQRHRKAATNSVIDRLPGVGPVRRKALLKHFGSTKRLRQAEPEEISEVEGIGPALAGQIYEFLRRSV